MSRKSMGNIKKIFILDNNVLLHDHNCICRFQENDLVMPIVALEELDNLKRGNDLTNFHFMQDNLTVDWIIPREIILSY